MDAPPIQAVWWGGRQGHAARRGGRERGPIVQRADHGWHSWAGLWNRLRCQLNTVEWEGEEGVGPDPRGTAPRHDSPDDSGVGSGPGVSFTFPAHH